jgi:uncharacterized protein (TIRG00374 family)
VPRRSGAQPAEEPPSPGPAPPSSRRRTWLRLVVSAAVGALLLGLLLASTDIDAVHELMGDLGPWSPLVLLPYALIAWADTLGWRCTFPPAVAVGLPFARLYLARMAGEGINSVTPTAAVGGEPVKLYLLRGLRLSPSDGVASLVIAKTALTVTQSLFVVLGIAAFLARQGLARLEVIALGGLLVLTAGFAVGLVRLQRRGPALTLWRWLHRVLPRARFVGRLRHAAASIDERLADFYRIEKGAFLRASGWHMLGWLLGVWEVKLMMWVIGAPITWGDALIIEAIAQPIRATAIVIPGGLGTQEIGGVAFCTYLGIAEPVAVTLWLLKRARELVFDGLGLLYLGRHQVRLRPR